MYTRPGRSSSTRSKNRTRTVKRERLQPDLIVVEAAGISTVDIQERMEMQGTHAGLMT